MTTAKNFHRHCLSEDLQAHVHQQLSKLLPEQLDLTEEVAIHKARCSDVILEWSNTRLVYNNLCKLTNRTREQEALIDRARMAMDAASQRMADAFKDHRELSLVAATVEAKTREAITERTIMLFLNAAIDLAHELFNKGTKETIELMDKFENMLRERVVVQEADGNALAIEGEIWAMMQTIEGPSVTSSLSEIVTVEN